MTERVHQFDPHAAPDTAFEPGTLEHLVPGNRGRLLDPRRTPISLVDVDLDSGHFRVRIEAFEDRGAIWEIPLERVDRFQFEISRTRAQAAHVASMRDAIARLARPLVIACDSGTRARTLEDLHRRAARAEEWLRRESAFVRRSEKLDLASRSGSPELAADFERFATERGFADIEAAFSRQWVSNPASGELVKGHRIVLAELGLVPYRGDAVRDRRLFDPPWDRARRAEHLLERLGFVRALFRTLGIDHVVLYRGLACDGGLAPPRNESFVAASFSFDVARSCMGETDPSRVGVLLRQVVPIERLFMTYWETAALNEPFQEAEAVLLWDEGNPIF